MSAEYSPGLLDAYLHGYQAFREGSGFSPPEQETVFLTISRVNGCAYCMSAHSMLAEKKSGLAAEVMAALRDDRPIPDPRLAALSTFTRQMVEKRGLIGKADAEPFLTAGYGERHMLEVVLAIAVKTLSNYSNHLSHTRLDEVFAGHAWSPPKREAA
jgi:AhpD family alkylhydroperoxidase